MIEQMQLEAAAALVHRLLPPTPQISWPLLNQRCGAEIWVKHENHLPTGAFKVRGGVLYMAELRQREPGVQAVIAATRGNHGQSVAFAAARAGLKATIVVPRGNSREKNAAMRAFGAEIVEQGHDFQASFEHATQLADEHGLHMVPSFNPILVRGVASAALELFGAVPDLDVLYVPVGMGSGICAAIAARDALGLKTRVIGVGAEGAPAYAQSFAAGRVIPADKANTIADGLATRSPDAAAVESISKGAERFVLVSDQEIQAAMRHLFTDTHNLAEGAGAAALAAVLREKSQMAGKRVAVMLTGGNIDRELYARIIAC